MQKHLFVVFLTLHLLSLSDLGRESSLDGGDGTTRTAVVAGNEVQTVFTLAELCVGRFASFASDVFN